MDNLWYPVKGEPTIRVAPDVYVVWGRPKGHRGSYQQWREDDIAPQVVFEILSPGNRITPIMMKHAFYDRYGVEEYYIYDPDGFDFGVAVRDPATGLLMPQPAEDIWQSPRLGVRFDISGGELKLYHPNGERFKTMLEISLERNALAANLVKEQSRNEYLAADLEKERNRAALLAARLRQLGLDE